VKAGGKRKSTAALLAGIDRIFQADCKFESDVIATLYGPLPDWLPESVPPFLGRAIASLRHAKQSVEAIAKLVAKERRCALETVPGTVLDVTNFFESVNYLAHVQWALSLGKPRAIQELAGSDAVIGNRSRMHQRTLPKLGNAAKKKQALEKRRKWKAIGTALRSKHPEKPNTWLAKQIARESGGKESSIRSAIPSLGLEKKKNC
jgi:hypothetical protein